MQRSWPGPLTGLATSGLRFDSAALRMFQVYSATPVNQPFAYLAINPHLINPNVMKTPTFFQSFLSSFY